MSAGTVIAAPDRDALSARVEEACLNAWPALQEVHYDGWLLRLADGKTRRTNSVNAIAAGRRPLAEKIPYCEAFYTRHGLRPYFRILSDARDGLDEELAQRGYEAEDVTDTLYADFAQAPPLGVSGDVELHEMVPTDEWIGARLELSGADGSTKIRLEKVLQALALPAVFAAMRGADGRIDAVAKGAIHDWIACINLVVTRPSARRQGLSEACVQSILAWAARRGAAGACLQVLASNTPALRLYRKLGFASRLYSYHYRCAAAGE